MEICYGTKGHKNGSAQMCDENYCSFNNGKLHKLLLEIKKSAKLIWYFCVADICLQKKSRNVFNIKSKGGSDLKDIVLSMPFTIGCFSVPFLAPHVWISHNEQNNICVYIK